MLIHHLLLAASVGLLLAAGVRAASQLTDDPLARLVAAAPFAATVAAVEALALGLVDLGSSPVVLFLGASAVWLGASRLISAPAPSVVDQAVGWWEGLSPLGRAVAGGLAGALLAWTAWLLRFPAFNIDSLSYHIPKVLTWVREGNPGALLPILPGWPYEAYPATNEVLLSWGSGLGRSFAWMTVWPAVLFALLAAAGWLGLRSLRVPALPAALATASVCAAPMATSYQLNGPNSDFPALVWLVVAAALCAASVKRDHEGLLVPALLAAALSVGTKTTTAPQIALLAAFVAFHFRGRLRPLRRPLLLATGAALAVGGTWYLRNLVEHGSPLWPFFATPWGDPTPHLIGDPYQYTFFNRPLESLERFGDKGYVTDTFLGALVAMACALLAPILARDRLVAAGAAATVLSVFLWTFAPDTAPPLPGDPPDAFYGAPRLLIPGVAVAMLTLALAARRPTRLAQLWTGLLAVVLGINVWQLFDLGFPAVPSPATPLVGAVATGALAVVSGALPWRSILGPAGLIAGTLVLGAALALPAMHIPERHSRVGLDPRHRYLDSELIPVFADGTAADGRPIYSTPIALGMLAGSDLARKVEAIPRREPCDRIAARARSAWLVVPKGSLGEELLGRSTIPACTRAWRPAHETAGARIYGPVRISTTR